MKTLAINVKERDKVGKTNTRTLRNQGNVPCVLYGGEKQVTFYAHENDFRKLVYTPDTFLVQLDFNGKKIRAIMKDIQFHPLSDQPIHVDFLRLSEDSKITLDIPTRFINEEASPGLKRGGVLNVNRRTVQLSCPANNIPEELVFDLTDLEIGDTIRISMVNLDEGVQPTITDRDFTVASVAAPTVVKEPEPQAEGDEAAAVEGDGDAKDSETEQDAKEEDKS